MDFVYFFQGVKGVTYVITLRKLQTSKQKEFLDHRSYKTSESTLFCIGNFEENKDLSRIYLSVKCFQKSKQTFLQKVTTEVF